MSFAYANINISECFKVVVLKKPGDPNTNRDQHHQKQNSLVIKYKEYFGITGDTKKAVQL